MSNTFQYDLHKHHQLTLSKDMYVRKGLSGLVNLGNTCFMNSAIQCLSATLKLTDYFLSNTYRDDDVNSMNSKRMEYFLVLSYSNLLRNMWETNQLIKPKTFRENLCKYVKKYYPLKQHDSHECLMYVLDVLHRGLSYEIDVDINGTIKTPTDALMKQSLENWKTHYMKGYSAIVEYFYGQDHTKVMCANRTCNKTSHVFEPYCGLSLSLTETDTDVYKCLDNFFSKSVVDTWKCDDCGKKGCTRETKLWTLPDYVIIHLKRFNNQNKKVSSFVDFPLEDLDLTQFVSTDKADPNKYLYSLYAACNHSGDTGSGHYWAHVKNMDGSWYLMNDGHVTQVQNNTQVQTNNAYVLFYYRKFIR